jgi:predicted DNA binding CopG/RHH family protein
MKSTKKNKISFGSVELQEDEFNPKNGKIRVTMWIELDLLDQVRKKAADEGEKYQPWIKKQLREIVSGDSEKKIENRLIALEHAVFKKRA